jgi:integrase/recombinase XerD
MATNIVDASLNRLRLLFYDKDSNPLEGKCISNFETMLSFLRYRMNEGLAPNTISNDIKALSELSKAIDKPIKDLTTDDIYEIFSLFNSKAKGTAELYKIKLRIFFKFIGRSDLVQLCVVKQSQSDRKLPEDLLTREDIELLIDSTRNLRDKAYFVVLYESGARKGELEELQLKHVVFDENGAVITLPKGKTGARRIRLVYSAGYLRNWIDNHPLKGDKNSWLWASSWNENVHINYMTLWGSLRLAAKRAGIDKRVNPHSFRHARATHLARDLTEQQLKAYLGWTAGSNMAGIYVHLSGKDLDKAILKLNGIATEEEPEDKALKTIKCPRCKEIQDKKASFCFKCGLPRNETSSTKIESDKNTVLLEVIAQLVKNNPDFIRNALDDYK